jgi:DNA-directed RNA polymerase sigma subunit (sigma70/sigma32)
MARSLSFLIDEPWPSDDGWPYTDVDADDDEVDVADPDADVDDDLLDVRLSGGHLFDGLGPLERSVLAARFGFTDGRPHTMREIQHDLGVPREALRHALGDGIAKVRNRLT